MNQESGIQKIRYKHSKTQTRKVFFVYVRTKEKLDSNKILTAKQKPIWKNMSDFGSMNIFLTLRCLMAFLVEMFVSFLVTFGCICDRGKETMKTLSWFCPFGWWFSPYRFKIQRNRRSYKSHETIIWVSVGLWGGGARNWNYSEFSEMAKTLARSFFIIAERVGGIANT